MRRIEQKACDTYLEALKCVEFRLPKKGQLSEHAYLCAIGLRYGLVGLAATESLLLDATTEEDYFDVVHAASRWSENVEEHLLQFGLGRVEAELTGNRAYNIGRLALCPVLDGIAGFDIFQNHRSPMPNAVKHFSSEYRRAILHGTFWWNRRKILQEFGRIAEISVEFALNFFERRRMDIVESSAIALIGD